MVAHTGADVAARMNKVGGAVAKAQAEAVRLAGGVLKSSVSAAAPSRLRNAGKKGGALSVRVTSTGGTHPTSTGTATGPWPLIEYDTPQHLIGIGRSKSGGRSKKASSRAKVKISNGAAVGGMLYGGYGHPVRGPIVHPGTKGKQLFHKGVATGTPPAVAILRKTTINAVKGAF